MIIDVVLFFTTIYRACSSSPSYAPLRNEHTYLALPSEIYARVFLTEFLHPFHIQERESQTYGAESENVGVEYQVF